MNDIKDILLKIENNIYSKKKQQTEIRVKYTTENEMLGVHIYELECLKDDIEKILESEETDNE